jgi:hypothetical protein
MATDTMLPMLNVTSNNQHRQRGNLTSSNNVYLNEYAKRQRQHQRQQQQQQQELMLSSHRDDMNDDSLMNDPNYQTRSNDDSSASSQNNNSNNGRKSRRVLFYKNGDKYFNGKLVTITPNRYYSFRDLMNELNRSVDLPYGVRRVYTPVSGREIYNIDELSDGASYVCASFEPFRSVKYGGDPNEIKPWNPGRSLACLLFIAIRL